MSLGAFVDDIVLNGTALPNDPNAIKIANTVLEDSRIRHCLIELDSMVDDGSSTTVGAVLTSLSDAEDNITALQTDKADSATVTALTTTVNNTATDLADHTQDTTSKRHINTVAGTDDYYLAYDSTMANGTNNAWKQLPASQSAPPMVFELKTAAFTAAANYFYQVDVSAPLSITLPATPVQGDLPIMFRISGASAVNIVTFLRNGENIERIADDGYITGNGTITAKFAGTIGTANVGWTLADGQTY